MMPDVTIPLDRAVLCVNCQAITNSRGEKCSLCLEAGGLILITSLLNPMTHKILLRIAEQKGLVLQ